MATNPALLPGANPNQLIPSPDLQQQAYELLESGQILGQQGQQDFGNYIMSTLGGAPAFNPFSRLPQANPFLQGLPPEIMGLFQNYAPISLQNQPFYAQDSFPGQQTLSHLPQFLAGGEPGGGTATPSRPEDYVGQDLEGPQAAAILIGDYLSNLLGFAPVGEFDEGDAPAGGGSPAAQARSTSLEKPPEGSAPTAADSIPSGADPRWVTALLGAIGAVGGAGLNAAVANNSEGSTSIPRPIRGAVQESSDRLRSELRSPSPTFLGPQVAPMSAFEIAGLGQIANQALNPTNQVQAITQAPSFRPLRG